MLLWLFEVVTSNPTWKPLLPFFNSSFQLSFSMYWLDCSALVKTCTPLSSVTNNLYLKSCIVKGFSSNLSRVDGLLCINFFDSFSTVRTLSSSYFDKFVEAFIRVCYSHIINLIMTGCIVLNNVVIRDRACPLNASLQHSESILLQTYSDSSEESGTAKR